MDVTQRWGERWIPFRSSFHLPFPPFPKKRLILRLVGNRVLVGHPMLASSSMALPSIALTAFVLLTAVMVFRVLNLKQGQIPFHYL